MMEAPPPPPPPPPPPLSLTLRRALLVLDLQNEFLAPTGRCRIANPQVTDGIRAFTKAFREAGQGDVIWIRSEFGRPRDVDDPRIDEKIILYEKEEEDEGEGGSGAAGGGGSGVNSTGGGEHTGGSGKAPGGKKGRKKKKKSRSISSIAPIEEFLGTATEPCVAKGSEAAAFHESVARDTQTPGDRVMTKTWYSAFKGTSLLEMLRGRLTTELYICGLSTNVSVLATTADAVKHGFEVAVISDCLGYTEKKLHELALADMTGEFGVEVVRAVAMLRLWAVGVKEPRQAPAAVAGGADAKTGRKDLVELIANLSLAAGSKGGDDGSDDDGDARHDDDADGEGGRKNVAAQIAALRRLRGERTPGAGAAGGGGGGAAERSRGAEPQQPRVSKKVKAKRRPTDPKNESETEPARPRTPASTPASSSSTPTAAPARKARLRSSITSPAAYAAPTTTVQTIPIPSSAPAQAPPQPPQPLPPPIPPPGQRPMATAVGVGARARRKHPVPTVLAPGAVMGEGDTRLVTNLLPDDLSSTAFENMRREVRWRTMHHRGGEVPRLVAVEGVIDKDGTFPIYRHPADESPPLRPFSDTVALIRDHVQRVVNHPVNHVLIQYYRDGNDYISEHSDKTLDIVRGSNIINVSLGAQRTMLLRSKKDSKEWMEQKSIPQKPEDAGKDPRLEGKAGPARTSQRIHLPHNSMFILGESTNRKWLHAIKQDKRMQSLKSPAEVMNSGERISLTFRHIGTFLSDHETKIWGQGATAKSRDDAKDVIVNDEAETEKLIFAFGTENHQAEEFDWEGVYGGGFDVLHFKTRLPKLWFARQDTIGVTRVLIALSEKEIDVEVEVRPREKKEQRIIVDENEEEEFDEEDDVVFVDADIDRTTVEGSIQILMYLETFYAGEKEMGGQGKRLFPRPKRHERGEWADTLKLLWESERMRESVWRYRVDVRGSEQNLTALLAGLKIGNGEEGTKREEKGTGKVNVAGEYPSSSSKAEKVEDNPATITTTSSTSTTTTTPQDDGKNTTTTIQEIEPVFPTSPPKEPRGLELRLHRMLRSLQVFERHLKKSSGSSGSTSPAPSSSSSSSSPTLSRGTYFGPDNMWSIADCAIWPVLWSLDHKMGLDDTGDAQAWLKIENGIAWTGIVCGALKRYYRAGWEKESVRRVFRGVSGGEGGVAAVEEKKMVVGAALVKDSVGESVPTEIKSMSGDVKGGVKEKKAPVFVASSTAATARATTTITTILGEGEGEEEEEDDGDKTPVPATRLVPAVAAIDKEKKDPDFPPPYAVVAESSGVTPENERERGESASTVSADPPVEG